MILVTLLTILIITLQVNADASSMLCLVNKERTSRGLSPMVLNSKLVQAAQAHSDDMANAKTLSHTGTDGSTPWQRMEKAGYSGASSMAENVAAGYSSEQSVMDGWMNSPGHRANILGNFNEFGMGVKNNYWTQTFGYRSGVDVSKASESCATTASATTKSPMPTKTASVTYGTKTAIVTFATKTATDTSAIATAPAATPTIDYKFCWGSSLPKTTAEWLAIRRQCDKYFRFNNR